MRLLGLTLLICLLLSACSKKEAPPSRVWHLPHNVVGIEHGPETGYRKLANILTRSIETRTNIGVLTRAGKNGEFIISANGKIIFDRAKEKNMWSENELLALLVATFENAPQEANPRRR